MSTSAFRHPRTSSSSQSPPRGRLDIASLPGHGPGIQYRSGIMPWFRYLARQLFDIHASFQQNER